MKPVLISLASLLIGGLVVYFLKPETRLLEPKTVTIVKQDTSRIEQLQNRIVELERALATTKQQLKELAKQNRQAEVKPEPTRAANPRFSMLSDKINAIPEFMLKGQLAMFFDEDALEQLNNPHQFAQRALEVALANEDLSTESLSANIEFSLSPVQGARAINFNAEVGQYEPVFAHIISDSDSAELLVKWQNISSGEVLMFRNYRLQPGQNERYISLKPPTGWRAGTYRVSLYSMNDQVTPFAGNSYSISHVAEQPGGDKGPNQKVIDDLLLSGQAVEKQK